MMRADCFDDLFRDLAGELLHNYDHEPAPRGQKVREKLAVTFCLENPRARLLASLARAANYRFAVGEFLWYLRGARDLESIQYYNKRMGGFSDDGRTLNSAYGAILNPQLQQVAGVLRDDPDSRRAVATVYDPSYLTRATKDVPCTLALQFFIRDGALDLHVTMRSNDLVWGLTNDLFSFTLMQEVVALWMREVYGVDLRLGRYYHTAGSMHLYERHFEMAERVVDEGADYLGAGMPADPMPPLLDVEELAVELQAVEASLRRNPGTQAATAGGWSAAAGWMVKQLNEHRALRDAEVRE